ncbi:histidine-type phosphatase [Metamycoplasma hominis]|uniref:Histidine-type phosphatase n=1 Tax=Metamycoplasma hominis TaxID=2098 RepID=A0A6A8Q050_METHO|nr:histidine-type phosphatase [Metamycoplasma hominis]MTH75553.1 hypothetical protein [Metamycoplasma hominis]
MKLLILSRHGLRYPFFTKERSIKYFNKDIVNWNIDNLGSAFLTDKGALFELKMAQKIREFFNITNDINVKVMANSTQRTFQTAQLLSIGFFPAKKVDIQCQDYSFKNENEWYDINTDNINLVDYDLLWKYEAKSKKIYQKIIDLFDLKNCLFTNEETNITLNENKDGVFWRGKFFMACSLSDLLVVKYYFNEPYDSIFKSNNFIRDLRLIGKAKDYVIDFAFCDKNVINSNKKNIYKLIKKEFKNGKDLTLIVGHDTNIATTLAMLDVKMPDLKQLEKYPIGSKLIFAINDDNSFDLYIAFFDFKDIRNFNLSNPQIIKIASKIFLK